MSSHVDYRLVGQRTKHIYHVINAQDTSETTRALEEQWNQLTEQRAGEASEVAIGYGRVLRVKRALKGIAWFEFAELCDNRAALGVADYAKLCEVYHTLFVLNVPRMSPEHSLNEARRFILLIDECYDHKVKLILSAHAEPAALFPTALPASASGGPVTGEEEIFAFSRTLSRLHEMQTTEYLEHNHEPHPYRKKDDKHDTHHHKRHVK
jgi:cell division protein ZapE